jgi:hypothetical protein
VAFQARRSNDPFDVTTGGTIAYDYIITNVGSAYDNLSGIFTAPVPGQFDQTIDFIPTQVFLIHDDGRFLACEDCGKVRV